MSKHSLNYAYVIRKIRKIVINRFVITPLWLKEDIPSDSNYLLRLYFARFLK